MLGAERAHGPSAYRPFKPLQFVVERCRSQSQAGALGESAADIADGRKFGLQLLISRLSVGRAFRATSDDQETAELMGIDNRRLYGLAMALSLGIVAVAGVFLGIRTTFTFSSGPDRLLFAFEAVIIGGLGSLWGTLVGGVVLGVAQTVGAKLSPGWGVLTGHLVFLAVLLLRPEGIVAPVRRVE